MIWGTDESGRQVELVLFVRIRIVGLLLAAALVIRTPLFADGFQLFRAFHLVIGLVIVLAVTAETFRKRK